MTLYGRHNAGRSNARSAYCQGCSVRLTIGEPHPTDAWPANLSLDAHQLNVLLSAAADYRALCAEVGEPERAVDFVDWLAGVARQSGVHPDHDGIEGEPFPLREANLPLTIRRAAS